MVSVWDPIVEQRIGTAIRMKLESTATEIIIGDHVSQFFSRFVQYPPVVIEAN